MNTPGRLDGGLNFGGSLPAARAHVGFAAFYLPERQDVTLRLYNENTYGAPRGAGEVISALGKNRMFVRDITMHILAVHDRPQWSMDHHCQDLKQALKGMCDIDIKSCGKKWESLNELIASVDSGYDRIYVAGEFLGPCVYNALHESLKPKVLLGVHSFFLWDGERSVGSHVARACHVNPGFFTALKKFRATAVICRSLQFALSEINPCLTHYGINTSFYHPLTAGRNEPKRLRIGWVGALLRHKNHQLFLRIKERLAGVVDCEEIVLTAARYFSPTDRVLTREGMNQFYNTLDLVVVTADSEGGPLPPLEAAGCGVPTITPCVGAMPEFIQHGIDGYLVDSYDAEDYVRIIKHLHENRDILQRMRQACLDKAFGPWNLDQKAQAWLEFFRQ